jgi:Na+-transporting methylmalonyl-CoA/oxaloacetate decarboxylase gamma subunit
MDEKYVFGLTLTVVGMGTTFISIGLLILLTEILKKVLAAKPAKKE